MFANSLPTTHASILDHFEPDLGQPLLISMPAAHVNFSPGYGWCWCCRSSNCHVVYTSAALIRKFTPKTRCLHLTSQSSTAPAHSPESLNARWHIYCGTDCESCCNGHAGYWVEDVCLVALNFSGLLSGSSTSGCKVCEAAAAAVNHKKRGFTFDGGDENGDFGVCMHAGGRQIYLQILWTFKEPGGHQNFYCARACSSQLLVIEPPPSYMGS